MLFRSEAISARTGDRPKLEYELILDETTAVNKALDEAPPSSLVECKRSVPLKLKFTPAGQKIC